ncbi:type II toxin-antitoxin system HicB family antitoxin [Fortiea sp. LEGE XX443]|uniref:type II toxin-antitoxin system HicB family antitoxin n=1 Tax=Fortiea sp. LEGE XX443 TaxID=1828611 RepID=UPI001880AB23|nr:type II toxin-antitoxin system HicB family antitoxin [Fortiea sp. LEGE XX443]MBE9006440.1 type II toxin-antitoxin system HicB family antitoxin [Fortiea sp. LEGE XX443]
MQNASKREFYVIIEQNEDGYYVAEVPQLTACYSQGNTIDELITNLKEVIELCLAAENKDKPEMKGNLRSEYELKSLKVKKFGSERKNFDQTTITLEPDVAAMFPNAEAVNEALRFLIRVTQKNQLTQFTKQPNILLEQNDT